MNKESPKKLGFWLATSLVVGNMTGSGIFLLPAALAIYGGISVFGWLFTTIGTIFLAFIFARLSKLIKKAGGPYTYSKEGFGNFPGFIVAWGYWISVWCGNAAIAVAGIGYLSTFIPILKSNSTLSACSAIAVIWLFTLVNTRSIRSVGKVQFITTIIKIIPLLLLGTFGFLYFNADHFIPLNISSESNFDAITATAALTLWAFLGLESATVPSDKVRNPQKTVPRATIAGTIIAAILYVASTVAVMGIVNPENLQNSAAPFAEASQMIWGKWSAYIIAAIASVSCFGALNGWILLQGQLPLAASRDKMFPKVFSKVSSKGIPLFGLMISSILASVLVSMNYSKGLVKMFSFIIMLSTLTCLLPYLFSSISELMLYYKGKATFTKKRLYAVIAISIPAFAYSLWAIWGLGLEIIGWGLVLLVSGVPFYLWVSRKV